MKFFKTMVITFASLSMAAPMMSDVNEQPAISAIHKQVDTVEFYTQECKATNYGVFNHYKIDIDIEFDKIYCELPKGGLYSNGAAEFFSMYRCKKSKHGMLRLEFNYWSNKGKHISKALDEVFPHAGGFDCPDY